VAFVAFVGGRGAVVTFVSSDGDVVGWGAVVLLIGEAVTVEFCGGVESSTSVPFVVPMSEVAAVETPVGGNVDGNSVTPVGDHVPEAPHDGYIVPNSPIPAVKSLPTSKKSITG
jgi:hypothetical protein